jgi:hypothetical protein
MKTYKQFMEQFSGYVTGSTNSRAGATMAKRASNASAAAKADKKSEKIVAATNREAKPVKPLGEDDRALDPSNVHEPKKNKLSEANRGAMAMRLANKRASQIKRNEAQREKQQKNVQARKSRISDVYQRRLGVKQDKPITDVNKAGAAIRSKVTSGIKKKLGIPTTRIGSGSIPRVSSGNFSLRTHSGSF